MAKTLKGVMICCVLLTSLGLMNARANNADDTACPPLALFDSEEILEIELHAPYTEVKRDVGAVRRYHPAELVYQGINGEHRVAVQVKTRGRSRRNPQLCNWPPLFMKFDPTAAKGTIFEDIKKLKLVTHCQKRNPEFDQYLPLEYLTYKMYNILTPLSFRVRLARVTYVDSLGRRKPYEKFGFFIENIKSVACRNGGVEDTTGTRYLKLQDSDAQILHAVFQFFIGNTDWSISARHNVKVINIDPNGKGYLYAIPYDFDYSGFVNTYYAAPHETVRDRIKRVRNRLYLGLCRPENQLRATFELFIQKRNQLEKLVATSPHLNNKHRRYAMGYIKSFYNIIGKKRTIKKFFLDNCEEIKKGKTLK